MAKNGRKVLKTFRNGQKRNAESFYVPIQKRNIFKVFTMHYFLGYSFEFFDDPKIAIKMFIRSKIPKKILKISKLKLLINFLRIQGVK